MSAQPLPCPFCGAELKLNDNPADLMVRRYGMRYNHPLVLGCFLDDIEVLPGQIDEWNRRAALATKGGAT